MKRELFCIKSKRKNYFAIGVMNRFLLDSFLMNMNLMYSCL